MSVTIKNRYTGEAIASEDTDDLREAVIRLVRKGVSLRYADLSYADLRYADLRSADLSYADLSYADLSSADLRSADLSSADLSFADLSSADLRYADLRYADLRSADLSSADLSSADLSSADLSYADLRYADLRSADLSTVRNDIWAVLSYAPSEVPALIAAHDTGRVDGSCYSDGECGCLVGTLAIAAGADKSDRSACEAVRGLKADSSRPAERFYLGIKKGDTPATNQVAKLCRDWAWEWLQRVRPDLAEGVEQQARLRAMQTDQPGKEG